MSKDDDLFSKPTQSFLHEMWEKRADGIPGYDFDWTKATRHEDVLYLLRQYPYLQLLNSRADYSKINPPTFIDLDTGWVLHDFGDAMSTSPGQKLYGPGNPELKEEDEGGHGTIVNQTFDTAQAMILHAYEKGWSGIQMVSGTHLMRWAAWLTALELKMEVLGFEPSVDDEIKRDRIKRELIDSLDIKLRTSKRGFRR